MKRSLVIEALRNTLRTYNNTTPWYSERCHAEEILDLLDNMGLLKPTHTKKVTRRDIECMPYEDTIVVEGWENE